MDCEISSQRLTKKSWMNRTRSQVNYSDSWVDSILRQNIHRNRMRISRILFFSLEPCDSRLTNSLSQDIRKVQHSTLKARRRTRKLLLPFRPRLSHLQDTAGFWFPFRGRICMGEGRKTDPSELTACNSMFISSGLDSAIFLLECFTFFGLMDFLTESPREGERSNVIAAVSTMLPPAASC